MKTQVTTEQHTPPSPERGPTTAPVWLLAFPAARAIPLPPTGVDVGRDYFAEHGHGDRQISGRHLRLSRAGGVLTIEDLASSNGIFLDGHLLPPHDPVRLRDGAILRLGKSLFVHREAFEGPLVPDRPEEGLVGPWGLRDVRRALAGLRARPEIAILIEGETGTGKELVSRAVAAALRRPHPFAPVNVAALGQSTLEGHLFGWKRGAFSGADRTDPGLIRANEGGTVFLDEIGELPPELQAKLLRVLENGEVLAIGEHRPHRVDVAFVAATNQDLAQLVAEKMFRTDLLARFRVRIPIPPLRDRPEDLLSLLVALWERRHGAADLAGAEMEVEAAEQILLHAWPANTRELDRLAASLPGDRFELWLADVERLLGPVVQDRTAPVTRERLAEALAAHGGNQVQAAKSLGVDRSVVLRLLKKHPELRSPAASKK